MKKGLAGLLVLVITVLIPFATWADDVTSYAILTDNGLLKIRGRLYRLDGIYIPEIGGTCLSSFTQVNCAVSNAVQALNSKISGFVRCVDHGGNRDGTLSAYCSHEGDDLGAFLVRNGYAMAAPNAPFQYFSLERLAERQGRGLWMTLISPGVQLFN